MANYNKKNRGPDVVNTGVGQAELAELQREIFLAASDALRQAREERNVNASLITACHALVRDAGMRPDAEGIGSTDNSEASEAVL